MYILCKKAVISAQHNNSEFAFDQLSCGNYTDSQRIGNTELICKDNTKLLSVLIKLIANNDSLHIQFVNQCKRESITF